jgi:large subunit ribosomal protein L13
MKTFTAKPADIERKWWLVDATGKSLGRLSAEVAAILRGKHKPIFTPHVDTGDHVIIVNAAHVVLTGNKAEEKIHWHSGYPGGLKSTTRGAMLRKTPERLIMRTVKGMLPHNTLGAHMLKKLRVYRDAKHGHEAQRPEPLELKG